MTAAPPGQKLRFRDCELDLAAYALRRNGRPVRLERQPMDLLIFLVERRDRLVTRAEIVDRLWGRDVFVDVETGVHTAIRKIRQALHDSTDAPVFLETVPGKGYRFIAEVEAVMLPAPANAPGLPVVLPAPAPSPARAPEPRAPGRSQRLVLGLVLVGAIAVGVYWFIPRTQRGAAPGVPITLAVLPFTNLSGDPDRDYLVEGLAEETAVSLGQIDPDCLHVLARSATLSYKGSSKAGGVIGHELGVDYLVATSLRSEAQRLRVTSSLIGVNDQVQVWSQSFDCEPTSLLGLQRELSVAIAEQIRLRLTPDQVGAMTRRETRSPEAYDLYLRGRNFESQRTPAASRQAIAYYVRATETDPDYALAWTGQAMVLAAGLFNGDASPAAAIAPARQAAAQAVRASPQSADALLAVAYLKWCCDWDWIGAESGMRQALLLDPRNAMTQAVHGHILSQMGRHGESALAMQRARELDPLSAMVPALSSQTAFQARDFPAALAHADQAIVLEPEFWIGHMMYAQALERLGRDDAALESLATAAQFSGQNSKTLSLRGYIFGKTGRTGEARAVLRLLEEISGTRYMPPYAMAVVSAGLGDRNGALSWLQRAYDARDVHLMYLPVDAKWDDYREDPRFSGLLARCGFVSSGPAAGAR